MSSEIKEIALYKLVQVFFLFLAVIFSDNAWGNVDTYCTARDDHDVVYLLDSQGKKGFPGSINSLLGRTPIQVVNKIYLQKIGEVYTLYVIFNEKFSPRIHTMSNKVNMLISFSKPIQCPVVKNFKHRLISELNIKKIGEKSLFMDLAFSTNIIFITKKYTARTLWISFKIVKKKRIVIDAGHGGSDPGTRGLGGEFEKNVTLQFAKELQKILEDTGRYDVIMTRQDDKFCSVEDRISNIIKTNADVLLSLHTDSNPVTKLHGMSIYTLPTVLKGRDVTPKYLSNLYKSRDLAKRIIGYIPKSCKIKKRPCRSTELKILKVTIPAILIEVGCLSNKLDYELLHLKEFRDKMNCAILYALDDFFRQRRE